MTTESPPLKWSAQLVVSTTNSQRLSGDKIVLPQSCLEELLSAAAKAEAEASQADTEDRFSRQSFSSYGDFTRRQFPASALSQPQLPQPLTFRLVNPANGKTVYAGIREFSGEENEIVLSPFLENALFGSSSQRPTNEAQENGIETTGSRVTVNFEELPKGTYIKLRPLEAGYDVEDWKAVLEQHLRSNYTTLTGQEILTVPGGKGADGQREFFRFLVDELQPASHAVCIVDTDVAVDIEALDEEQARETLRRIAEKLHTAPGTEQGSSVGSDLDLFKSVQGQILPGEYVDYQLPSWPRDQALELSLSPEDETDDIDLLLNPFSSRSRVRPRSDDCVFADHSSSPNKRIRLERTNVQLEQAEALWVSVHAYRPETATETRPLKYQLRARLSDANELATTNITNGTRDPDDVQCKNCKKWIPKRTAILHENFCFRNNILCPQGCGQVFQKNSEAYKSHWHCAHDTFNGNTEASKQKHDAIFHPEAPLRCSDCSTLESFSSIPLLAQHRSTVCPAKIILCRFCHLEVPQGGDPDVPNAEALLSGLTQHELEDGSRTTECHLCGKITRLRDLDVHMKSHDLERKSRSRPRVCRNIYCGRTLDGANHSGDTRAGTRIGQGPGNEISLCSVCFSPLYVSLYDPEGKALKRRVERRYLQQLLTGCGKEWCRNEYCKQGRAHAGIGEAVSTKEAIPMVKPFVDGVMSDQSRPLHFCVDKASQESRLMASMLFAEYEQQGDQGYDFPWCIAAMEAEGGAHERARTWLGNYAPRKAEERLS